MTTTVRFAPSPTGNLHIGGARTALFNYLFAKHTGGKFILRIEDTDKERSKKEFEENIFASMKWLGLDHDELYRQSERMDIYKEYAVKLAESGKTYKCFCTKEELDKKRKLFEQLKRPYKYDGTCRKLAKEKAEELKNSGKPFVVRFKMPEEGETVINDLVRGKITFDNKELDDIILERTDGVPTYNFCVVVDDALMKVTHIIRGEDHISNTPRQIQLYKALGFELPEFAHIPLILASDKTRLSKRAGAAAVTEYQDEGYIPQAVVNFLALLGCSYSATEEIFPLSELIKRFELTHVNKSAAIFDFTKLDFLNGYYIRQKTEPEIADLVRPFLLKAGITPEESLLLKVVKLEKERLKKLTDIIDSKYFFTEVTEYDPAAFEKHFKDPAKIELFKKYRTEIADISFIAADLEAFTRNFAEKHGKKLGELVHPIRLALTGKLVSPGLFEVMEVLGKEVCMKRLNKIV
ncbi:MAG: glutamate--tRNA ligase [Candidatus Firestonebacteria bacterium RIFOXYA2_FULL_40_8]|nr:MAG: glutamate--tRNA ligase [Candidatus Firestonebacteria bacterium RIFOXYA2_FULL_40_8]